MNTHPNWLGISNHECRINSDTPQFGGREAAMEHIVRSIGGPLPPAGPFEVARNIGGQTVIICGAVVDCDDALLGLDGNDGTPRIGTAFSP